MTFELRPGEDEGISFRPVLSWGKQTPSGHEVGVFVI